MDRPTGSARYADWQDYADDLEAELYKLRGAFALAISKSQAGRQELKAERDRLRAKVALRDRAVKKLRKDNRELHEAMADYREKLEVAQDFAPTLGRCVDCGSVVARGYCCGACGSTDPSRSQETRQ